MEKIHENVCFDEVIFLTTCLFTYVFLYFLHLVLLFTPHYIIMVKGLLKLSSSQSLPGESNLYGKTATAALPDTTMQVLLLFFTSYQAISVAENQSQISSQFPVLPLVYCLHTTRYHVTEFGHGDRFLQIPMHARTVDTRPLLQLHGLGMRPGTEDLPKNWLGHWRYSTSLAGQPPSAFWEVVWRTR